jgi:hypothetical protein
MQRFGCSTRLKLQMGYIYRTSVGGEGLAEAMSITRISAVVGYSCFEATSRGVALKKQKNRIPCVVAHIAFFSGGWEIGLLAATVRRLELKSCAGTGDKGQVGCSAC